MFKKMMLVAVLMAGVALVFGVIRFTSMTSDKATPASVRELKTLLRESKISYVLRTREITEYREADRPTSTGTEWEFWVIGTDKVFVYPSGGKVELHEGRMDSASRRRPFILSHEVMQEEELSKKVAYVRNLIDVANRKH